MSGVVPSMGLECDMESSQEELLEASETVRIGGTRYRTVTMVAGLLSMCAALSLWHNPSIMAKVNGGFFVGLDDEEVGAASEEDCGHLPFVKLTKVISSNLGKQGPDKDAEEGIIYEATAYHTGVNVSNLQIHVHSLHDFDVKEEDDDNYAKDYSPTWQTGEWVNGIHGKFACIGVRPGESLKVRAHAYDDDNKEDIPLPHAAISFFDLDAGEIGENGSYSVEHVTVRGFKDYFVSNETEVNVTTDGDFTVFTATTEGTGEDNPQNPNALNTQQKNRAVTVEFEGHSAIDFEVGATAGKTWRVFSFVFRPSLLCAATKLDDGTLVGPKSASAPIVPVQGAAYKELPSGLLMLGFLSAVLPSFM